ncbi:RING/FYVE/PHD zinc finger superfamily protein [Thalictrum thalictroides]|uniref:RING/FYVE/PHD zinc finger superfamily protein n=1 Tax=Thalictrum thalictroides TaxID=46969 RepID=A0A7J6WAU1_THATH|nr:RING/FYVE/PHD zinc finger superfamily protein [Thalictrum thalictroides]
MTPVLEGNYRIQGPLEETDHTVKKTGSSRSEKRSGKCCATGNVSMKAETGTCNVCAAPCSSCGHFNQAGSCMEIKAENEFSDEVSRVNAASRCSSKDASVMPSYKKRECGDRKPTASETSNLVSASSSHDSMSENAESKASLRMSDSNEDEMLQKDLLGRGDARDHHFSNGEDASCVSGANDACASVRDVGVDVDRKSVSCSAASVGSFIPEGIQSEITLSKDIKDFEENFSSQHMAQHVQPSSAKLETITGAHCFSAPKSEDVVPKLDNNKGTLVCTSSSEIPMKDNSCLEPVVELPAKSMDYIEKNEQKEKSSGLFKVPNNQDPPLKSQPLDVSDGSDIVEDDVKVCDICGDAGREDLLAICSRCSDGAEHTYCMRVMMDKVPEGDWLCEVCQMKEEANQRKNKHETVLGAPKISCLSVKTEKSAGTLKSNISLKSDSQLPDTEADKAAKVAPSPRLFPKRHLDTVDLASAAKRQALESNAGSPKPSSPIKPKTLSRESSFKNLDKGKLNAIHPMPPLGGSSSQDTTCFPALSVQNSSKIHPQLQSPRGALSKSSSFNTSNSKAKVKMVQEVPQKHKLGRHPSIGGSRKEGLVKTINKSASFSMGSSHSNPIESKPKVHSPNVSRAEDSRKFKLGKERNIIEKKNSFKSDRLVSPASASNILSPRDDKKVSPRGEATTLPSSTSKFRDSRAVQADFKSSSSSKSTAGRDFKRQSSLVSRSSGYSSFNGNAAEQKSSQAIKKAEIAANLSAAADGPSSNSDMFTQDSFPMSRECMMLDTKGEETSFNQSRQNVPAGGKSIRCHKCKEIGHASQFCPNGSIRVSVPEATTARSSRDIMNRISKLKDVNEADFVTSYEMCKKSGDQSDELFMSRAGLVCEVAPKDQFSNSLNCLNNSTSSDAAYDRQESFKNCTGESNAAVTDVNYKALQPTREVCTLKEVDINAIVSSDGNHFRPSSSDLQNPVPSSSIPSRVSPIPELDYIWQGGFEVHQSGRHVDFYDGIQAHLSTCASPKVLEVVDKLPHKVLLEEVSRSSTWPTQFQNCATEDNIALYFFAKDVESYGRSYETLVENMMKNDLALKGILNGIELLIFPSNKLCENSKRWNMFYFLWGVFRAKRENLSHKINGSLKIPSETNLNLVPLEVELPSPIASATQNESSPGNIDEELHTSRRLMNRHKALPSTSVMQFPSSPGSGRIDLNAKEEFFCNQKCLGLESSSPRHIADSDSSLMIPASNVQSSVQIKGNDTSMGRMTDQRRYTIADQEKAMDEDIVDANYVLENGPQKSDLVENNDGTWVVKGNHKRPYSAMAEMGPQTSGESSACTSQRTQWKENTDIILVDEEIECKKKRVCSETYSSESSRGYNTLTERYSCQMLDLGSNLPMKEQGLEGANDCAILPESLMTTERYFFPVESGPSKGIGLGSNSIPVQVISSDEEDQLESERPNLDLALGGEKKSSNKRMVPLFELLAKNNNDHGKCPEIVTDKCEEDSLGSLSLSLAVPFSEKMVQMVKPVAKEESERNHIDTSLFLFGGFSGT